MLSIFLLSDFITNEKHDIAFIISSINANLSMLSMFEHILIVKLMLSDFTTNEK